MEIKLSKSILEGIGSVILGELEEFDSNETVAPRHLIEYMEFLNFNFNRKEDWDTNGWEYDWFANFRKEGREYNASGSGYSGGFIFMAGE